MKTRKRILTTVFCVVTLFGVGSRAQTPERRPPSPAAEQQSPAAAYADPVANELALLRKSLQTLNARLRDVGDKFLAPDSKPGGTLNDKQSRLALSLDILSRAEQRAELLRRQLLELTEKETYFRTRLMQIDEDLRPESVDRTLSLVGSTRSATDLRDARRRVLDNERKGVESLLGQTSQSRLRLEDDVKQADALVAKIRQRLLPLIEKEIDKLNPEEK